MPSFKDMQDYYANFGTIGQQIQSSSNFAMEETWWNDPQSKKCYIYDYFHDDQPNKREHMTYEHTTKTPIDAKFIIKEYQSIDKDQVGYYLQFRPSQKFEFESSDDLYYFETDYRRRFMTEFPIGLYVDLPDERNVYRKWMIVEKEYANQFLKFLILPCNYNLTWVEIDGQKRVKRKMWSVLRNQNSYTIGQYTDTVFTRPDNQTKIWLPLNSITQKMWYNTDIKKTMRLVMSAPTDHPIVWSVTKIENFEPIGIQKITLYQNVWNDHTDYVERDENGNIIGMYADYYNSTIEPEDTNNPIINVPEYLVDIKTSTYILKVGGSYKLLKCFISDDSRIDITENYSSAAFDWTCSINDEDFTDKVTWLPQKDFNTMKIKFPNDRTYLGKTIHITCTITSQNGNIISGSCDMELSI